mmetsp:Transcript_27169/g.68343  ORF Transcript_27169/g.68343 Transcript_27169/m.68343 type:complete len:295 (+) Transcript_27169:942-1826(+)
MVALKLELVDLDVLLRRRLRLGAPASLAALAQAPLERRHLARQAVALLHHRVGLLHQLAHALWLRHRGPAASAAAVAPGALRLGQQVLGALEVVLQRGHLARAAVALLGQLVDRLVLAGQPVAQLLDAVLQALVLLPLLQLGVVARVVRPRGGRPPAGAGLACAVALGRGHRRPRRLLVRHRHLRLHLDRPAVRLQEGSEPHVLRLQHLDAVLQRACHLRVGLLQGGVDRVRHIALLLEVPDLLALPVEVALRLLQLLGHPLQLVRAPLVQLRLVLGHHPHPRQLVAHLGQLHL